MPFYASGGTPPPGATGPTLNRCRRPAGRTATVQCLGDSGGRACGAVLPPQTVNVQHENQRKVRFFEFVLNKASHAMHFVGIGAAARCTEAECLKAFQNSDWLGRLDAYAHFGARTVLQRDNDMDGIGLSGPNLTYLTACSLSAMAIGEVWLRLSRGALDGVVAGGAEAPLSPGVDDGLGCAQNARHCCRTCLPLAERTRCRGCAPRREKLEPKVSLRRTVRLCIAAA